MSQFNGSKVNGNGVTGTHQPNPEVVQRQVTLAAAYARNPDRFVHGVPVPPALPTAVWINPPAALADQEDDHV